MPALAALAMAARAMLPATVAVATADPMAVAQIAWPGETLPNAVLTRQREFAAGRSAARAALHQLGHPATALPMGPDRAPIWPPGLTGSITHSATLCLVAVTHTANLVGVDLEPATPLSPDLWDVVLRPEEQAVLAGNPNAPFLAKLIFSAKEAAYKAQYARSRTLLDFDALQIVFAENTFTARFTQNVPGYAIGATLIGRATTIQNHFLTIVSG